MMRQWPLLSSESNFILCYKVILHVLSSQCHLIIFFYHLLPVFVQFIIFHLMSGRDDVAWLAHGRELRAMWCCLLPKGLGTSQGPHGLVYTGQPQRDWLGKQWTNKVTMEPSPKQKSCDIYRDPNKLEVLKSCKATVLTNDFELNILYKFCCNWWRRG